MPFYCQRSSDITAILKRFLEQRNQLRNANKQLIMFMYSYHMSTIHNWRKRIVSK